MKKLKSHTHGPGKIIEELYDSFWPHMFITGLLILASVISDSIFGVGRDFRFFWRRTTVEGTLTLLHPFDIVLFSIFFATWGHYFVKQTLRNMDRWKAKHKYLVLFYVFSILFPLCVAGLMERFTVTELSVLADAVSIVAIAFGFPVAVYVAVKSLVFISKPDK